MTDLPGKAIHDFYFQNSRCALFVHDSFGPKVRMPVSLYFRDYKKMPELEKKALPLCRGKILDVGAGAGSHALELQKRGLDVTALEISPASCEVMKARGVKNVVCDDFFALTGSAYDTILLLMNGIGISGNLQGFRTFLKKAAGLLAPGGQVIFDSCDISYMYEDGPMPGHYYGEVKCCYEYGLDITDGFSWLYIDVATMKAIAAEENWRSEIVAEDQNSQYLAVLTKK